MTTSELQLSMHKVQKRYTIVALMTALICGGGLILFGYPPLGKGLAAGALFSVLNFMLIAKALPARLGHGRAKTFIISFASICGRFVLMALPLIFAIKHAQIAVSTVAIGLFTVPAAILAENVWQQWRHSQQGGM